MAKNTRPPPTPLPHQVPAPTQDRSHERRYYRYATPIAILAFLASCAAAAFAYWQATLVQESNTIAIKNNIVSQRAFTYTALTQTYFSPDAINPQAINFLFNPTNSGNTPTRNLTVFYKCVPAAEDVQEPWVLLYQGGETIRQIPQFIGPHASGPVACSFPIEQIKSMVDGKLFGFVMIDVTYHDRLDVEPVHKTHTALRLSNIVYKPAQPAAGTLPPGQPPQIAPAQFLTVLEPRGRHNCADEECPP